MAGRSCMSQLIPIKASTPYCRLLDTSQILAASLVLWQQHIHQEAAARADGSAAPH